MLGIENRKFESKSSHVTTNTTNTLWNGSVLLLSLVVCASAAGTTWAVTVQTKESTPKIIYKLSPITAGTFSLDLALGGVEMTAGIDVITSGTTPGVLDVWASALKLDHE